MARFVEIDVTGPADAWVVNVCSALTTGAILVHPTTSVYGIGGAAPETDAETARLKGRAGTIPILRLVRDSSLLRTLHPEIRWGEVAERLTRRFWPGPLTVVFDDGSRTGIAARAEGHPVTRELLASFDGTIGSTSLNLSGQTPVSTLAGARRVTGQLPETDRELLLLAAGDLPGPPPSTLVSLREGSPRLLRAGAVSKSAIEAAVGSRVAD